MTNETRSCLALATLSFNGRVFVEAPNADVAEELLSLGAFRASDDPDFLVLSPELVVAAVHAQDDYHDGVAENHVAGILNEFGVVTNGWSPRITATMWRYVRTGHFTANIEDTWHGRTWYGRQWVFRPAQENHDA